MWATLYSKTLRQCRQRATPDRCARPLGGEEFLMMPGHGPGVEQTLQALERIRLQLAALPTGPNARCPFPLGSPATIRRIAYGKPWAG